jgi:hypothetical protein
MLIEPDNSLELRVKSLQDFVRAWLVNRDLWHDCGFTTWNKHFDDEPSPDPVVLVLTYGSDLHHAQEAQESLSDEVAENLGYWTDLWDYGVMLFRVAPTNQDLLSSFRSYFEWQWLNQLIEESYCDLYSEVFEYFAKRPERLNSISHRGYERFLDAVFRNNGYRTVLGPGSGDGGVDIRLYGNDVIGEVVTLVQAKRYATKRPIGLEAVQALSGAVQDERANRGLFVTTSRYLPSARKFAVRQQRRLVLADSTDLVGWSRSASELLQRDLSVWTSIESIGLALADARESPERRVFFAHSGLLTLFALLLREVSGVALLLELPSTNVTGDGQRGTHVPDLQAEVALSRHARGVFRARRAGKTSHDAFWGRKQLWSQWDGKPLPFDID